MGKWADPDIQDCLSYMLTEAGEAMDAYLRTKKQYTRNNPTKTTTNAKIAEEVFDTIMMGIIALDLLGEDLRETAEKKLSVMEAKRKPKKWYSQDRNTGRPGGRWMNRLKPS